MKRSRTIPAEIRRAVRQRCGFGCVVCGLPLYEYDHLDGWAVTGAHVSDRIVLLCDKHHRERTNGLLPTKRVEAAAASPLNLQTGASAPYALHFGGSSCEVRIGNNDFTSTVLSTSGWLIAVMIDDVPLVQFRLEDGHLLLTIRVFNHLNHLVLLVEDNELVYRADQWDIEMVGRRIVIREAKRNVLLDLTFDPPSRILVARGNFLLNGVQAVVNDQGIFIANLGSVISNLGVEDSQGGLFLGVCDESLASAILIDAIPRYKGVVTLVSTDGK
jgi:trigger factor